MDLAKLSDDELIALYQQSRGGDREARYRAVVKAPDAADPAAVIAIGAGRQGDKLVEGLKELGLSANVAAREAVDANSGEQLRGLAGLEQTQKFCDEAYQPLREQHPFLTGVGENAYLAGVPVGQATVLGRIAAPAIAAAGNEMLSYGSPQERGQKALASGAMGAGGGAAGEVVRALLSPAKSTLSAAQQAAMDRASQTIGYKPRASEMTGNETLRRLEDAVARQPGGAGPMRDLMEQNDRSVSRHLAKGIGEDADALTTDVFARASERRGAAYDELRERAKMPVVQPIFDAVGKAQGMLARGDPTGPKKQAFDVLERLKEQLYGAKEFNGAVYQAWTSDLAAHARTLGKENRTAAAALREVEKAMDAVARGPDAPRWAKLDKEHAAQELLMKPGMVNEQTGRASTPRIASQMERQFGKNWKTGRVSGEVADVAALGRALPPMREGSQTAGREAFGGLPGWLMAAPNYAVAKGLTSELGRDYLSRGLLGSPEASRRAGGMLGRGAIPLSLAELEMLALGYQ